MNRRMIPAVPNTGRHNSCHINCCHMALQFKGENIPFPKFVPLSAFTFGFLYVNDGKFILPAISGCPCRECMKFITEQLGYSYEIISGENLDSVMPKIKDCIDANQPLVAGPLPMELYRESTATIIDPTRKSTPRSMVSVGPLETLSMSRFAGPLPLSQSMLIVVPYIISLIAITVVCFAISYIVFMRQEIRSL